MAPHFKLQTQKLISTTIAAIMPVLTTRIERERSLQKLKHKIMPIVSLRSKHETLAIPNNKQHQNIKDKPYI